MPKQLMSEANEACKTGKWTSSEPKANSNVEGFLIYPRDTTRARNPCPSFVTPILPMPFKPSVGKNKTLQPWTKLNMELSVREPDKEVIEFGDNVDIFCFNAVKANGDACYGEGVDEFEIKMKQRRTLVPKKEFKRKPKPPYLWRFKIRLDKTNKKNPPTRFWKVTGKDEETGGELYEPGTIRDLVPWCRVCVSGTFTQIYASNAGWGPNFDANDVLIYEPDPDDMGADDDEEVGEDGERPFAFAGIGNFAKRKADEAETSTQEGGETGQAGEGEGSTSSPPDPDDQHDGKRLRTSIPNEEPYSDDDGNN